MTWKSRYMELRDAVEAIDVFLDAAMPDGTTSAGYRERLRALIRHERPTPFRDWLNKEHEPWDGGW